MGENVLQSQVKSFKKGADRSLEAMSMPTLFERPEIISTTYTAAPVGRCAVSEGDQLEAHASHAGEGIVLAKGHISVARIKGDGSNALLQLLLDPRNCGVMPMRVTKVSAISGFIKVVVANRETSRGS